MARKTDKLAEMVAANDKLLKATIALLALRDEHLLDELRIVFRHALQAGSEIGQADEAVWAHIRHELNLITNFVEDESESDGHDGADGGDDEVAGAPPRAARH